jgi:CheY-like chemotaxis protein
LSRTKQARSKAEVIILSATNISKVVLVVEDEPLIRMNTADIFETAGYKVLEAPNADEALSLVEARKDIGVIVTDIDMPGSMDGLAMAQHVRQASPSIGLILASGKVFPPERQLPAGARFFSKPFQEHEIVEAVAFVWPQ